MEKRKAKVVATASEGTSGAVKRQKSASAVLHRLGGLTQLEREAALCEPGALPPAVRVAPARSTYQYIHERIIDVHAVRKFLDAPVNADRLHEEKITLVQTVREREKKGSWRGIERRIHETLLGSPDKRYSIEKCVHRVSTRLDKYSFEQLVASEYLDFTCPAAFWQIRILIVLIMIIDDSGSANILADYSTADNKCAYCFESMTEAGEVNAQLEPCRHWLCIRCAREAIVKHGMNRCGLCRCEVRCAIPTRVR